jgi:excisionase family DNA binding protein
MQQNLSPFMTMKEAAEVLRVDYRTVQYWMKLGRIQPCRVSGRSVRFKKEDVLALISDTKPRLAVFGRADAQP